MPRPTDVLAACGQEAVRKQPLRSSGTLWPGTSRAAPTIGSLVIAAASLAACSGGGATPSTSGPSSSVAARHSNVYTFGVVGTSGKVLQLEHTTPTLVSGITGTVVQIATSNSDSYALTSAGTVFAWGVGSSGQLGDGSTIDFMSVAVKVKFPAGVRITSLANPMPYDGALVIDSRADVWGWGVNSVHELCLPGTQPLLRPTRIPLTDVSLATGAGLHSLFDSKGTVYACGSGVAGELGTGSTSNRSTPTAVIGLPNGGVKALTSSWKGSGALMDDGAYYDWGFNHTGQLGDGTTVSSSLPVLVHLRAAVVEVSQGGSSRKNGQTLAMLADGSLWAWGNGQWGQLGDGRADNSSTPVPLRLPNGARAAQVSSGGFSCYAVDTSGKLWAWGRNEFGQLGTGGSQPTQLTPVSVGVVLTQVSSTATNVAGYGG